MSKIKVYSDLVQGTDEWLKLKVGKVSGSQIIGLTTDVRMKTYLYAKIDEVINGCLPTFYVNEFMRRGTEMEPIARDLYNKKHPPHIVKEVGLITNSDYKYGVLSPDGVSDDLTSAIEIKSPMTKTHIKTINLRNIPNNNLDQVIWYFVMIPTLVFLDFVSFDDRHTKEYVEYTVHRHQLTDNINYMIERYFIFEKKFDSYLDALNLRI